MAGPSLCTRMVFEPQRELAFGDVEGTYVAVGTPLNNAIRQFFIQNLTDVTLQFSFDGINDHFPLPSNGFFLDDICSNTSVSQGFFIAKGTTLYVKEIGTPSSGSVYFSVAYGKE